jgi:hypothetical protein
LSRNHVSPARLETAIDEAIRSVLIFFPIVVILDGFLRNEQEVDVLNQSGVGL